MGRIGDYSNVEGRYSASDLGEYRGGDPKCSCSLMLTAYTVEPHSVGLNPDLSSTV